MKKLLCAAILILSFCAVSFAQNNQSTACPEIDVTGPSGIPQPGETVTFTANISGTVLKNITYIWTISTGEISEGQGTPTITVKPDTSFTVTVEIKGLPESCPNASSETVFGDLPPQAEKIDEFSLSEIRIDKARIDNLIAELQNDPTAQAYIIERFSRNISQRIIDRKIQKIGDYLVKFRKQDKDRFTIIITSADENSTQFWIVPAGATPPTSDK